MADRQADHLESQPRTESTHQSDATHNLQQQALLLYGCKDGSIVSDPKACRQMANELPNLEITGTQLAGRTVRQGPDGLTSDGGKVQLG